MQPKYLLPLLAASTLASGVSAATTTVTVNGTDNPFLAGQPNGTACCAGDSAPGQSPALALTGFAPGQAITFAVTGGFSNTPSGAAVTADGFGTPITMDAAHFGISGAQNVWLAGMVGVFLDDTLPGGIAPSMRNDGMAFATLSPGLRQIFWIGDGLTGSGIGTTQQFFAPAGATRLYLGIVDGFEWNNNAGSARVSITYAAVPEPATWGMMILGFGALGGALRRSRRRMVAHPA